MNLIQMKFDTLLSKKGSITYHRKTDRWTQFPVTLRPVSFSLGDRYELPVYAGIFHRVSPSVWFEISLGKALLPLIYYQVIQSNQC